MKKMKTRVMALFGALAMAAWGIGMTGCSHHSGSGGEEEIGGAIILYKNGVSQGEKGSVAEALKAISTTGTDTWTIELAEGIYTENEQLTYNGSANIKITGKPKSEFGKNVIIKGVGSDYSTESGRSMFEICGTGDIIFESITMEHADKMAVADKDHKQREVIGHQSTGTLAAYNCSFISRQDTIRTESKAWFFKCYVEGDVDFLWIESKNGKVALYEECTLVAVSDRNKKAYFTAPRLNVANTVGKGVVIWKSVLKADDGLNEVYLGRNPWDEATDREKNTNYFEQYYENVTVVASTWVGKELNSEVWYGSGAHGTEDQRYVGFKTDGYFQQNSTGAIIGDDIVSSEYSDRNAILNRVYNITEEKFENDAASSIWNIAAIEAAFGAGASGDLEQETFNPKSAKVVWDLASAWTDDNGETSIQSSTQTGVLTGVVSGSDEHTVKMHINANANGQGGKFEAQPSNGRTQINQHTVLTVPVTDGSVVSVTTYNGSGTHGIEGTERDTYTHSGGATEIIIYCTGNGYLTEVAVSKLDLTALSDEQKNATATGSVRAIALDHKDFELMNGLSETVKATAYTSYGATAGSISWGTSDGNVATVSNGTVTAKADSGTAKITATCGSVSASCTVTATKAVAADLSKAEVTWDLKPSTINIQSSTGTVNGKIAGSNKVVTATVDATNGGKLQGDGTKHAQFNSGTKITIPVSNGCTVTVTASSGGASYALYTIAGTAASTTNRVSTYTHSSGGNTIDIVSTGAAYLESIVITNLDATSLAKDAD